MPKAAYRKRGIAGLFRLVLSNPQGIASGAARTLRMRKKKKMVTRVRGAKASRLERRAAARRDDNVQDLPRDSAHHDIAALRRRTEGQRCVQS